MNDLEYQGLAILYRQYPQLVEVTGSFTFNCTHRYIDGEAQFEIPFGEWRWHFREPEMDQAENPEWLAWFKYHVIDELERYGAFRVGKFYKANADTSTASTSVPLVLVPSRGRLDFEHGKLALHWFISE